METLCAKRPSEFRNSYNTAWVHLGATDIAVLQNCLIGIPHATMPVRIPTSTVVLRNASIFEVIHSNQVLHLTPAGTSASTGFQPDIDGEQHSRPSSVVATDLDLARLPVNVIEPDLARLPVNVIEPDGDVSLALRISGRETRIGPKIASSRTWISRTFDVVHFKPAVSRVHSYVCMKGFVVAISHAAKYNGTYTYAFPKNTVSPDPFATIFVFAFFHSGNFRKCTPQCGGVRNPGGPDLGKRPRRMNCLHATGEALVDVQIVQVNFVVSQK